MAFFVRYVVSLAIALILVSSAKADQRREYNFDIPRQAVEVSLTELANQANVSLLFPYDQIQTVSANPVRGMYTVLEALEILLRDTGMEGGLTSGEVITISQIANNGDETGENNIMKKPQSALTKIAAALFSVFSANGVSAQEYTGTSVLEEVLVTAQKRSESLRDVPISVAVVGGEKINQMNIARLEELSLYVPNFAITQEVVGDFINIRGIQSGNDAGIEQSVATFVDGVYRGRGAQIRFAFLDPERVEVLRGPQGSLFGKNSIAGALNITSAKPSDEFEAQVDLGYEFELEEVDVKGYVTGPLAENVSGRLAFMYRDSDKGWLDNVFYDNSVPLFDEWAIRGSLAWDVSDVTQISVKYETANFERFGHPVARQFNPASNDPDIGSYNTTNMGSVDPVLDFGSNGYTDGDSSEFVLTVNHDVDWGTWTLIAAHSEYEFIRFCDCDYSPADLIRFDDAEDFDQQSVELRFASEKSHLAKFDYVIGGYYHQNDLRTDGRADFNFASFGLGLPSFSRPHFLDQQSDVYALYSQATWSATDRLRLNGSLRYTHEEKDARHGTYASDFGTTDANSDFDPLLGALLASTVHDIDLDRKEEDVTWSGGLQFDLRDETMSYFSVTTGKKSGGFSSFSVVDDPNTLEFEDESAITYEIGLKTLLLDNAAELNIAVFYSEFEDLQISSFDGGTAFIIVNAAKAESQGVEIDGRWRISDNLMLSGSFGWIDFKFKDFKNAGCSNAQLAATGLDPVTCSGMGINDLSGRTSINTPKITYALSLNHTLALGGAFQLNSALDLIHQDEQYRTDDLDPISLSDTYTKLNARLQFGPTEGSWDVSLLVKNLTDEKTFSYSNDTPLNPGAYQFGPERPRTIALRWRKRF